MAIFNSYVKLPEGICGIGTSVLNRFLLHDHPYGNFSSDLPEVIIQVTRRKANGVPLQEPARSNIASFNIYSYTYHEA